MLRKYAEQSAIARDSAVGAEIDQLLRDLNLDVAYWSFTTASQSFYGRDRQTCPAFTFGLRRNEDFEQMALVRGNWDDDWPCTEELRNALNAILEGAGLDTDYVSDQTFIFPASWEAQALQSLAYLAKPEVLALVRRRLTWSWPFRPGGSGLERIYFGSYWGDEKPGKMGQYNLLFSSRDAMMRGREQQAKLHQSIAEFLRERDSHGFCGTHDVGLAFWYSGQIDLPPLYRED